MLQMQANRYEQVGSIMIDSQASINATIDGLSSELREINRLIHENPELGYEEHKAHDNITAFLRTRAFDVKPHAYSVETSFMAEYGTGGRVVVFNAEYDALPGIGHACGHNLIATGSIAAFLAVAAALKENSIPGRVRLLGTPAEEGGGGKIKLINAGAYEEVDACLMTHPMAVAMVAGLKTAGIAYGTCVASIKFQATFSGKPSHAAATPHEGINALDAAVLAYSGLSMLRQQIKPNERIQGIILEGGSVPNVITPRTLLRYNVRSSTLKEAKILHTRVVKCFEGAAIATGCTVEFQIDTSYADLIPNGSLCTEYARIMEGLDLPQLCNVDQDPTPGSYSTDMGNVSYVCPGFHGVYSIPLGAEASNHTPEFTAAAGTDEAHRLTLEASKGVAGVAWTVLTDDDFAREMKEGFLRDVEARG